MKKRIVAIAIIIFCGCHSALFAQQPPAPASFRIIAQFISADTNSTISNQSLNDSTIFFSSNNLYKLKAIVKLQDTTNTATVLVKVGTAKDSADIKNSIVPFDSINNTIGYKRNGFMLYLDLGEATILSDYYARIELIGLNGLYSIPVYFSNKRN